MPLLHKNKCVKRLFLLLSCLPLFCAAQPAGYYNNAFGQNGQNLRAALHNIISINTIQLSYGGSSQPNTWTTFQASDKKPNGKVWDIYSDKPGQAPPYEYDFVTDQCGNYNGEGDCYNHEHSWPQSYFNENFPMKSDLFHIYPTDGWVNGKRGDLQYGVVTAPTYTSQNGSKVGNNTYPGSNGTSFEPIDSFKGDLARSYFYMTTRYYTQDAGWLNWEMATGAELKPWAIQMLLDWHHNDPVSSKELTRNEAIYAAQNNRNPFIDFPKFADCIWAGNCTGLSIPGTAAIAARIRTFPNPAVNQVTINWAALAPDEVLAVEVLNLQGQLIYQAPASNTTELIIPVREWSKGLYLLQVRTQHGIQAQKLIVQ